MNTKFQKSVLIVIFGFCLTLSLNAQIDYKTKIATIWSSKGCISCHGGSNGLFLDSYNSLMTTGNHAPVIVAKDTNSVLVKKLRGTAGFGVRMPYGGPYLSENEMQPIIQWIKEGAKENVTTQVEIVPILIHKTFSLEQNYPNPFNPSTFIKFNLSSPSFVSLKIYNSVGVQIADMINEKLENGSYQKEWNAKEFPSGIYYARLESGNFKDIRKMVLIR